MIERIILDCDTGHDDAVALIMAAGADNIKIEGIVAAAGNQTLENTLENNLNMVEAMGIDCSVYVGVPDPLLRDRITASEIHGKTGLDGPIFPKNRKIQCSGDGIQYIIDTVMSNPNEITLVPTGPLTDIAIAMKKEPKLAENIKKIVLMGGSLSEGNVTESAEFNIYADPEAAQIVFSSKTNIVMMGLDVTLQVLFSDELDKKFKKMQEEKPTRMREIFLQSMGFYTQSCLEYIHDYPAMHDPCCIAYLMDPTMFSFERRDIRVETKGELTYGRTVGLWPSKTSKTLVGKKVDSSKFWDLLADCFYKLP